MRYCIGARALYGVERGEVVHRRLHSITGHWCACTQGQPCPMLPQPPEDDEGAWDNAVAGMDSVTPQAALLRILS